MLVDLALFTTRISYQYQSLQPMGRYLENRSLLMDSKIHLHPATAKAPREVFGELAHFAFRHTQHFGDFSKRAPGMEG